MKGIILAGGQGTRLLPITKVVNKHLLPVYNKPMIFYPIETLVNAGIDKIMLISSPESIGDFVKLLGSGEEFISLNTGKQIQIIYGVQTKPTGIADALWIAKDYIGNEDCVLHLGDNIFIDNMSKYIENFKTGAEIFLHKVNDPKRFGIAEIDNKNNVISIEEKPVSPKSNFAITGLYIYDNTVFNKCINQPKSDRGEYEITYINNLYLQENKLNANILSDKWLDAGTPDSLLESSLFLKKHEKNLN